LICLLVDGDKIELLLQVAKVIRVEGVHADDVCVRACARVCRSALKGYVSIS
jgi:hypothetical protein